MGEKIIMSKKEVKRISIVERVAKGEMKQNKASNELNISIRQFRRILRRYRDSGVSGLIHKLRGCVSNRRLSIDNEAKILTIVRKKYYDFGPTLASEKLLENNNIKISKEKLRQIMIKYDIWKPKKKIIKKVFHLRKRRKQEGELVQIDGSYHSWFEDRAEHCCLIVYIDDATGKIKNLLFCKSETTNNYFNITKSYIKKFGLPVALYSDKHSVFRINSSNLNSTSNKDMNGLTQFGRAMDELNIKLINAHSPQAKGRVERVNKTLQDRLIKELRLAKINSIDKANIFVEQFITNYNKKFSVIPNNKLNAHKALDKNIDLNNILKQQFTRVLSKNLTLQYKNIIYQIKTKQSSYVLKSRKVVIKENNLGGIKIFYKGRQLTFTIFKQQQKYNTVVTSKDLNNFVDKIIKNKNKQSKYKPNNSHPWKSNYKDKLLQTV